MATRTKSFFDQDHSSKKPPQWTRPNHASPALRETDPNALPSKPVIAASAQARSKLKAFQFIPGKPEEKVTRGDELVLQGRDSTEPHEKGDDFCVHEDTSDETSEEARETAQAPTSRTGTGASTKTPSMPHANTFPSTPGMRLALEDLVGNCNEDTRRAERKEQSPEEQLGWIPFSPDSTRTPRHRRKRARSSSPSCPTTSSQRREQAASLLDNPPLESDVAANLWQRYVSGRDTGDTPKPPELGPFVFLGSPRALETPIKGGGLRRWASTGNEWPSSRSKRRKTTARGPISVWQDDQEMVAAGNKSKVAAMVEQLQATLATQRLVPPTTDTALEEGPSSSEPLPESAGKPLVAASRMSPPRARVSVQTIGGPKPRLQIPHNQGAETSRMLEPMPEEREVNRQNPQAASDHLISAPLLLTSKAPLPGYKRPVMRTKSSEGGRQYPPAQPAVQPEKQSPGDELDEFGDAFDLSAEDLDQLMTQSHPTSQHATKVQNQVPSPGPNTSFLGPDLVHTDATALVNAGDDDDEFGGGVLDEEMPSLGQDPSMLGPALVEKDVAALANDDDDDDEFGGDDLDEDAFAQAEINASQAYRTSPKRRRATRKSPTPRKSAQLVGQDPIESTEQGLALVRRYIVQDVREGTFSTTKGLGRPELVLLARSDPGSSTMAITLRGSWASSVVNTGDVVHTAWPRKASRHVAPRPNHPGQLLIDDGEGSPLLILHPDHMLSATTVADSFDCIRKAVLQDRVKATGEASKAMVYGKILHEIFQQALSANRWDTAFLIDLVERTIQNHVEGLWELGMTDTNLAREEVTAKMGELTAWAAKYMGAEPSSNSVVDDARGEKASLSISKLIAIEEHVWSPRFGLKGNIDATIQSAYVDAPGRPAKRLLAPFEVKTGRTTQSAPHRAQTSLYTLLLSDRYDLEVQAGVLYYLESSTTSRIAPPSNEIRQMVQQRNRLASYINTARNPQSLDQTKTILAAQGLEIEESGLPSLLKDPFRCGRCYAKTSCFTFHALAENGSADSAGMIDDGRKAHQLTWQAEVGHLNLSTKDGFDAMKLRKWFVKWDRLLTFEESEMSHLRKELWTMTSTEREAVGRCFGDLIIDEDLTPSAAAPVNQTPVDGIEGSGGRINRFTYALRRQDRKGASLTEGSQLTVGEPIVVSSETGQWALANGYIVSLTKRAVTVAVDRMLTDARQRLPDFDEVSNQNLRGVSTTGRDTQASSAHRDRVLYRLDKDEFSNGLALVRNSIVTLMSSHPIHTKLRRQIVFSEPPAFHETRGPLDLPPSQLGEMNDDQRAAVSKVLGAQDYALILGMPGTGKTTTIAHIIRALLAEKKSILLTSFTHTAVDNILLKIRDIAPENSILRIGIRTKINEQVQRFCQLGSTSRSTIAEVEAAYMGCQIVATTCMGTNHAVFSRRAFDVCIVDEASQITLPTSLGPLLHARKFVLVGDHFQLPPLVQNRRASEGGLNVSLFSQLSEEHPEAVAVLGEQYRMCEDVMSLANTLIYNGKLRCGNEAVARRTLSLPCEKALHAVHHGPGSKPWLAELCKPSRKVVFGNIDSIGKQAVEVINSGKNITNEAEMILCTQVVTRLLALGVPAKEIGVITLYRSQLAFIRRMFKAAHISRDVEIDSADRFQGRDKEVIILSMVRSNASGIVGDLLKDWRRVNVALTRARSKLIVFGSRQTLVHNELLARFVSLVEAKGWAVNVPRNAVEDHDLESSVRSATTATSPLSKSQAAGVSPGKVLQPSSTAGNRTYAEETSGKRAKMPVKTVNGRTGPVPSKTRQMKENIAIEIFEDLMAEDLDDF